MFGGQRAQLVQVDAQVDAQVLEVGASVWSSLPR
jgi:hypothetical protein